jgi:hypothetical protein
MVTLMNAGLITEGSCFVREANLLLPPRIKLGVKMSSQTRRARNDDRGF